MSIPLRASEILADDRLLDRLAGRDAAAAEQVDAVLAALAAHADRPLPARSRLYRRLTRRRTLTALAVLAVGASGAGVAAAVNGPGWSGPRPQHFAFDEAPATPPRADAFTPPAVAAPPSAPRPTPTPRWVLAVPATTPGTDGRAAGEPASPSPRHGVVEHDGAVSYVGVTVSALAPDVPDRRTPATPPVLLAPPRTDTSGPPWSDRGPADGVPAGRAPAGEAAADRKPPKREPAPAFAPDGPAGAPEAPGGVRGGGEASLPPVYTFAPPEDDGGMASASVGRPPEAPPTPQGPPETPGSPPAPEKPEAADRGEGGPRGADPADAPVPLPPASRDEDPGSGGAGATDLPPEASTGPEVATPIPATRPPAPVGDRSDAGPVTPEPVPVVQDGGAAPDEAPQEAPADLP